MKRLIGIALYLLLVGTTLVVAQPGPGGPTGIIVGGTPVVGGSVGQCLIVGSGIVSSGSCGGGATSITVGTTTVASGTNGRVLFNNSGTLGEKTVSGTGGVALLDSPVFTTQITSPRYETAGTMVLNVPIGQQIQMAVNNTVIAGLISTAFAPATDNATTLGASSFRWSDIRSVLATIGTGTFTTSATVSSASVPLSAVQITGDTTPRVALTTSSTGLAAIKFSPGNTAYDTFLSRQGVASLRLGDPDATTGVSQAVVVNPSSGTNVSGGNLGLTAGTSTGNAGPGVINLRTGGRGSSGSSVNSAISTATIGSSSLGGNDANPVLTLTQTWNTSGTPDAIQLNLTNTASNAASNLLNLKVGGNSTFAVRVDGQVTAPTAIWSNVASDAASTTATLCRDTTSGLMKVGSGAAGICLGTSSARYKRDVAPLARGLAEVSELETVSYRYREGYGTDRKLYGFTAEQVFDVMPELVGLDAEGRPNSVDWAGMVPVLVNAIRELRAEVAELRSRR